MSEQPTRGNSDPTTPIISRSVPPAPAYASLPAARARAARGGSDVREISVRLAVVTPILGGAAQTRAIDEVDVVRGATVRGHLRFWWRALYAARYRDPAELYERESEVWGRGAETDNGGRSVVEIRVDLEQAGAIDDSDIDLQRTPGAYALWPARAEKKQGQIVKPPVPRRSGPQFRLTLTTAASREAEVRNTLRAWILFGGYGGRTRRGLGSFKVLDNPEVWLPSTATREAITMLFGDDVLASSGKAAGDVPWLEGAALHVGKIERDSIKAWTNALDWLKEFRQGTTGQQGERAREPGTGKPQSQRPSISNWPEPDKIRHLRGKTRSHKPRHNATPAWPRAGFGLPILGRFQTQARGVGRYDEPGPYELRWKPADNGEHGNRLASPLVVKALSLADGTFVPCALWLNRAYPDGDVVLQDVENSAAPFGRIVAPGDAARFSALADKTSLRQAFLDWLRTRYQTTVVAP